jgi:hypothetical protein
VKILLLVMVVTVVWAVLACGLGRCGRPGAGESHVAVGEAWFWESLDRNARFTGVPALPSSHPLARLGRPSSQPTV